MGTDFHGQDVTKAAKKAVKDAVSRSCLCGLDEVLGLTDFTRQVRILATVAVSRPEEVDCAEVASALPVGTAFIMVLVSVVLTLVSGLIPAQSAAKKDPVIALRTE